jgi:hypothetical protein
VKKRTETCEKEERLNNPERRKAIFTRLLNFRLAVEQLNISRV